MPFSNRIRLPLFLSKPQFPDTRNVFKRADGVIKVLSVNISKVYAGETDYMPEWVHQCLKIALSHDNINIERNDVMFGVVSEGDYDIDWSDFLDDPIAQAKFKLAVTPFNFSNSNCQSCDDIEQLSLADDTVVDQIQQSTEYTLNVLDNDIVNCFPITCTLTFTNAFYIDSATLGNDGVLTFTTRSLFFPRNSVILFTYRVTCSNGSSAEATVYGNLSGDEVATCLEPLHLVSTGVQDDSATFTWDAPDPAPAEGYEWKIALADSPSDTVDSGTTADTTVSVPSVGADSLLPSTEYIFSLRSSCGGGDFSDWLNVHFFTEGLEDDCGTYRITFIAVVGRRNKNVSYIACNGTIQTIKLHSFRSQSVCAQQSVVGTPTSIIGADTIQYIGPC